MNYAPRTIEMSERLILRVLTELNNGQISEAVASFADGFKFIDCGIGLEFDDKVRLAEFFEKTRDLYPDSVREVETVFASGSDVVTEWTLRNTVAEPFFGNVPRRMRVVIHGVTVVRTQNGTITRWSDYYDSLTARRTALSAYFTEWIEA